MRRKAKLRFFLALLLVVSSLATVGVLFWRQDWQYSLPTPRPLGLYQPPSGSFVKLSPALAQYKQPRRALFLHFLNPQCPCSQFNLDHIRSLTDRFRRAVDFVAVLQGQGSERGAQAEYSRLHLNMPMVLDKDAQMGFALGVYSTPQAVLLDGDGRLYFRGNYNVSRYCTEESTEFARLALFSLTSGRPLPAFPRQASIAYGCPLRKAQAPSNGKDL